MTKLSIDRRALLVGVGSIAATSALAGAAWGKTEDMFPVATTANGKLRGLTLAGGWKVFKGVNYAAETSGANRFLPPKPVKKWVGTKDALDYGNISPQVPADRTRDYANLIFNDVQPGGMGEDCLNCNIWTPTLDRSAKKPVLVRFHGGGFYGGSCNSPGMDGEMLSRFGDCVVVAVNHRLSAYGFLHLTDSGAPKEFAQSGMCGMLDLSAALKWVHENIEGFGGDPSRVMIFGQSGGGAKVSTLMAMPSAKGLFHRAVQMSGARLRATPKEVAKRSSDTLLKGLNLKGSDIKKLQALSWRDILSAQADIESDARRRGEAPGSFSPVLDGVAMPRHPFDPDSPAMTADVPMIISTTLDERTYRQSNYDQTWAGVEAMLKPRVGEGAKDVVDMYRKEDPKASAYLIQSRIISDQGRGAAYTQAERKAAAGKAPAYAYLWKSPAPAWDGRYGATHATDVGPSMHEVRGALHGPNTNSQRLADELGAVMVSFAATGDPNNKYLPKWEAFEATKRTTMVFDNPKSHAESDPRADFRKLWQKYPATMSAASSD